MARSRQRRATRASLNDCSRGPENSEGGPSIVSKRVCVGCVFRKVFKMFSLQGAQALSRVIPAPPTSQNAWSMLPPHKKRAPTSSELKRRRARAACASWIDCAVHFKLLPKSVFSQTNVIGFAGSSGNLALEKQMTAVGFEPTPLRTGA